MMTNETAPQFQALHYRIAQIADLQRQREALVTLAKHTTRSLSWAMQIAKLDATLRIARNTLAMLLASLPAAERLRFIKTQMREAGCARPRCVRVEQRGFGYSSDCQSHRWRRSQLDMSAKGENA